MVYTAVGLSGNVEDCDGVSIQRKGRYVILGELWRDERKEVARVVVVSLNTMLAERARRCICECREKEDDGGWGYEVMTEEGMQSCRSEPQLCP